MNQQDKQSNKPSNKYLILKGFCYEDVKGDAIYVPKKVYGKSGATHEAKIPNVTSLSKEAIELGKKLKAIKAV